MATTTAKDAKPARIERFMGCPSCFWSTDVRTESIIQVPCSLGNHAEALTGLEFFTVLPGDEQVEIEKGGANGIVGVGVREPDQPGRYAPPNLTIRTFVRGFTRLSLGFSKKLENLAAAVALHVAHYNFVRRHGTLTVTPAMKAGVANSLWSLESLYNAIGN